MEVAEWMLAAFNLMSSLLSCGGNLLLGSSSLLFSCSSCLLAATFSCQPPAAVSDAQIFPLSSFKNAALS